MRSVEVEFTDNMSEWKGGVCEYPTLPWGDCKIYIRSKYKGDVGLLEHEMVHYKQWKRNILHSLLYKMSCTYRLKSELEAYQAQITAYKYKSVTDANWIIESLFRNYDIDMCYLDIRKQALKVWKFN